MAIIIDEFGGLADGTRELSYDTEGNMVIGGAK